MLIPNTGPEAAMPMQVRDVQEGLIVKLSLRGVSLLGGIDELAGNAVPL
jgi:hypothetical protein